MTSAISQLARHYPDLEPCLSSVEEAYILLENAFSHGCKLLVCGNGGSAADADHIVGELMKGFLLDRPVPSTFRSELVRTYGPDGTYLASHLQRALPAIALTAHPALSTAFSNDVAGDTGFAQQVYAYGRAGDVLLALSTSGRSANVIHACRVARLLRMPVIGLTGRSSGAMKPISDVLICVPYDETPRIQERHLPVYHALCIDLEARFFGSGSNGVEIE